MIHLSTKLVHAGVDSSEDFNILNNLTNDLVAHGIRLTRLQLDKLNLAR